MRILVVGGGGREHALVWKLSADADVTALFCAPGNPGIAAICPCHPVAADDVAGLVELAGSLTVDLVVVGPEVPLSLGLADRLTEAGIATFGPSQAAARLESSKAFSKDFMARHSVPTARYGNFTELASASAFLDTLQPPFVLKASGLAAGKGVVIAVTREEADQELAEMLHGRFGAASSEVVIEEFMPGEEASVFAICDGTRFVTLPVCQDHKRAFDGDQGPNTGGMGAYAPAALVDPAMLAQIESSIIAPTLAGMAAEGNRFTGVLFVGIMVTPEGPKVVEYNCRFGDPECEVLMPLLGDGFARGLKSAAEGRLDADAFTWFAGKAAVTVIMAAEGYPGAVKRGSPIQLKPAGDASTVIFHAGTALDETGALVASGGRVLAVTGVADGFAAARTQAYAEIATIEAPGLFFRSDIGWRELARRSVLAAGEGSATAGPEQ
jgi:phosphoribosylamine---glycine ligase